VLAVDTTPRGFFRSLPTIIQLKRFPEFSQCGNNLLIK
jgi:hypothetical protein